jgi:arginyl-tRNA synthetase
MLNARLFLFHTAETALQELYNITGAAINFEKTSPDFEGDFTLVVFPFVKAARKSPEALAKELGEYFKTNNTNVASFNVIKGFLNITLTDFFWLQFFNGVRNTPGYGLKAPGNSGRTVMLEYSSPNTNKPLHLGHVRNNLLGYSVAEILKANGHQVIKSNLVNDRGIHICKSMLAWQKWGNGETPASTGMKGDHLVGKYYVEFDKAYKKEIEVLCNSGKSRDEAEKEAPIMHEAREMLRAWESGDTKVRTLWQTMNGWVYDGFSITYKQLGIDFDKMYYESDTYILGKEVIEEGLNKNVFYKKENGSIAIDLRAEGLDEKIVLRSDGTSVYITQDLGTAIERFRQFPELNQLIYTVGNEQDYHFKVLFKTLEKLGYAWASECYHLSYGMVELPEGKMKSREGTVVDADELIDEMINTAEQTTRELGKVEGFNEEELRKLYSLVGLGALKYFILKVDPKKKMLFDPKESIDFNGHTGPFIQYTHARIKSVLRKAADIDYSLEEQVEMNAVEKEIIRRLYDFEDAVREAGLAYSPAVLAIYVYELTKLYNRFYHECPILAEQDLSKRNFRLQLCAVCARIIARSMALLGIEVPEKM